MIRTRVLLSLLFLLSFLSRQHFLSLVMSFGSRYTEVLTHRTSHINNEWYQRNLSNIIKVRIQLPFALALQFYLIYLFIGFEKMKLQLVLVVIFTATMCAEYVDNQYIEGSYIVMLKEGSTANLEDVVKKIEEHTSSTREEMKIKSDDSMIPMIFGKFSEETAKMVGNSSESAYRFSPVEPLKPHICGIILKFVYF